MVKRLTKAVQETSVIFGLVILAPLGAAITAFNIKAFLVIVASFIFYLVFKLVFETRDGEDEREKLLNKTGKCISAVAVAVCLMFSLFLLGQQRLVEKVALASNTVIKKELKTLRQGGLTTQIDVNQGQDILKDEDGVATLHERGSTMAAPASRLLLHIFTLAGNYLDEQLSNLVSYVLAFSAVVIFIGWVGKTVLIPAQKERQQSSAASGGGKEPEGAAEASR